MCMVLLSWVIKLFWVSPEGNLFHFRLAVHYTLSKTLNVSLNVSILMFCCTVLHAIRIWRYSWEAIINVILLCIFSFDLKTIRYGVLSKVIFFSIGIVMLYGFLFSSFLTSYFFFQNSMVNFKCRFNIAFSTLVTWKYRPTEHNIRW